MINLCSTNLRFGVYHWKLLYTVLEIKALTLQKITGISCTSCCSYPQVNMQEKFLMNWGLRRFLA